MVAHRVWSALRPPLRVGRVLGWVCAFESVLYLIGLVTTALVIGLANSDYVEAYSSLTGYDGTSFYFGYEVTMATGSDINVSYLVAFAAVVGVQILVVWWSVGVVRRLGGSRLSRTVRTPQT